MFNCVLQEKSGLFVAEDRSTGEILHSIYEQSKATGGGRNAVSYPLASETVRKTILLQITSSFNPVADAEPGLLILPPCDANFGQTETKVCVSAVGQPSRVAGYKKCCFFNFTAVLESSQAFDFLPVYRELVT
jgi:hypothetical protein